MKRLLGLLCLLSTSVACITFSRPGDHSPAKVDEGAAKTDEPTQPPFDAERTKLSEARKHLEAKEWEDAARLAFEVRESLRTREDRPKNSYPTCKKFQDGRCTVTDWELNHWFDWVYAATAVAGIARTNAIDELAGLMTFETEGLVPKRCPTEFQPLCDEMEAIAQKEKYSALFEMIDKGPVSSSAKRVNTGKISSSYYFVAIAGLGGYNDPSIGHFLKEYIQGYLRKNHKPLAAVWVRNQHESKLTQTKQGQRTSYAWRGEAHNMTLTSCKEMQAKLKIGNTTYDLERCTKRAAVSHASTVTLSLSDEESKSVDFEAGDAALVVFEVSKVTGSAISLNMGSVRLARVAHQGEKLQ